MYSTHRTLLITTITIIAQILMSFYISSENTPLFVISYFVLTLVNLFLCALTFFNLSSCPFKVKRITFSKNFVSIQKDRVVILRNLDFFSPYVCQSMSISETTTHDDIIAFVNEFKTKNNPIAEEFKNYKF